MAKHHKNKINLFFCINSLQNGGAEKQLNYLSNYLSLKYNVYIFTLEKSVYNYKFNSNIMIYNLNNLFYLFFFIKKLLTLKPKVVFLILPKAYFYFGSILIFFPHIKRVLMRRSLNYYQKNKIFKYYEIFLHKFTYFFICNSYSSKKNLISSEYVGRNNIMVIDNFIKLTKYSNRKKKNLKFKILCIANFYKYKGHYLLLKSLSLIKDIPWELHLLGQSRDLSINQIKKISREFNIEKRVKYLKKIKKEYSYPYYSLGVLFSETESFPNAILEYFSLKLPVLAFNVGDISRLINIKNGSLLNKRNPNYVAMKINELYLDKNLDNKSKFSFSSIKKFSNTQKTLEKYNQFIEKLCVE